MGLGPLEDSEEITLIAGESLQTPNGSRYASSATSGSRHASSSTSPLSLPMLIFDTGGR